MEAQRTVMLVRPVVPVGCESPEPSLVVVKWAWLDTAAAQLAVEDTAVTRTGKVPPEPPRSVGPHVRCWVASMVQTGVAGAWGATVQVRPPAGGRAAGGGEPCAGPGPG